MVSRVQKATTLLACVLALAAHLAASSRYGLIPAVGPLLSPYEGFWQNADAIEQPNVPTQIDAKGLKARVDIRFDSALVPHIEAANLHDLFFAQGYVCAAQRLWQMDFITRAAAGRMSEVLGERALEYDRFQRRFGMGLAAEAALDSMLADPRSKLAVEAYTAGANAYLSGLDSRLIPLEFKILGYTPEPWTPLKTAYLLKFMAYDLTGHSDDAAQSRALGRLGWEGLDVLFPSQHADGVPVIPKGTPFNFSPVDLPSLDTTGLLRNAQDLLRQADRRNGSNNWAVAGSRTASGKPLLANDPHLRLHLPSLWMRMQLSAPGFEVSGYTLPGAPAIIIGHNRSVAWGVTNADVDVLDMYAVQRAGKGSYRYQGKETPFKQRIETIGLRDNEAFLDTVLYTEVGPIVYTDTSLKASIPKDVAVAWTAHRPSNDFAAFLGLAQARNVEQARRALARMNCPAQNFALADTLGNIAMVVGGKLPLRGKDQGRFVERLDAPSVRPMQSMPAVQNPQVVNPAQGFVASANQASAGPEYPYYLNWRQGEPDRGDRIAQRLGNMKGATIDSMADVQRDVYSPLAARFLPIMLNSVDEKRLVPAEREVLEMLRTWNLRYDSDQIAPTIFHTWFTALEDSVWLPLDQSEINRPMHGILFQVLVGDRVNPIVNYYDVDVKRLLAATFRKAYRKLISDHGAAGRSWQWGRVNRARTVHMGQIPGLSGPALSASGVGWTVNATNREHGPSMRMVVDLKPPVRGYGNQPGGQSGNPGSPYYLTGLEDWRMGRLQPWINYPRGTRTYPKLMAIWQMRPR